MYERIIFITGTSSVVWRLLYSSTGVEKMYVLRNLLWWLSYHLMQDLISMLGKSERKKTLANANSEGRMKRVIFGVTGCMWKVFSNVREMLHISMRCQTLTWYYCCMWNTCSLRAAYLHPLQWLLPDQICLNWSISRSNNDLENVKVTEIVSLIPPNCTIKQFTWGTMSGIQVLPGSTLEFHTQVLSYNNTALVCLIITKKHTHSITVGLINHVSTLFLNSANVHFCHVDNAKDDVLNM